MALSGKLLKEGLKAGSKKVKPVRGPNPKPDTVTGPTDGPSPQKPEPKEPPSRDKLEDRATSGAKKAGALFERGRLENQNLLRDIDAAHRRIRMLSEQMEKQRLQMLAVEKALTDHLKVPTTTVAQAEAQASVLSRFAEGMLKGVPKTAEDLGKFATDQVMGLIVAMILAYVTLEAIKKKFEEWSKTEKTEMEKLHEAYLAELEKAGLEANRMKEEKAKADAVVKGYLETVQTYVTEAIGWTESPAAKLAKAEEDLKAAKDKLDKHEAEMAALENLQKKNDSVQRVIIPF